ncbi:MAG: endonuclease [Saprospiraceae bacterium]|nr:endonuclease [Saprospiraceae bacterium]
MTRLSLFFFFFGICSHVALAQVFEPVFPEYVGEELRDSLAARFRPASVLDYANARDTLFAKVLAVDDDTLRCIYSGHKLYLDPTQDPTQYVYLNGSSLGMNTEHAYPQSKGASKGNPRSDMHHLFPARIPVNEARGNAPYAEIPDALTQKWFRGTQILFSVPTSHIDEYTESRSGAFEPRESVKGDVARAVFYFYTVYRGQANAADPNFFESQRLTLCQWNEQDPPDSAELVKTWRIATYQDGKPNPFVLDCTLAHRCWCPDVPTTCTMLSIEERPADLLVPRLSPNPFNGQGKLQAYLPFDGRLDIVFRSMLGKEVAKWVVPNASAGAFEFDVEIPPTARAQMGIMEIHLTDGQRIAKGVVRVVGW